MPRIYFFYLFIFAVILFFGLVEILLLRYLNRVWWKKKWVRRAAWSLPVVSILFFLLFGLGEYHKLGWLAIIGAGIGSLAFVMEATLMIALPISGLLHFANRLADRYAASRKARTDDRPDRRRRVLLHGIAAAVPTAAISMAVSGVGRSYGAVNVFLTSVTYRDLPKEFNGLRILHLSDLHLRHYVTLADLEEALMSASELQPDLVLVTGDVADDLRLLPDALSMIAGLNPRLGTFGSLGNHEYFRGVEEVRAIFDRSPVPLLVDHSQRVQVGQRSLQVLGIDDPVLMRGINPQFFEASIRLAQGDRPAPDFSILMSHRPDAFPTAHEKGIDLTLAGHTHGGQIGFMGRSMLESALPDKYLWGHYTLGSSRLYTSCGFGHWFPFRLGCPPEAPVIELRRA